MQEIIINKDKQNTKTIAIVENGILIEQYIEKEDKQRLEGNIYLGKVENILPGMQAAFVNIGEGKNTFIHLRDILPKVDITKNEKADDSKLKIKDFIKRGDYILVQVKRDSNNKKGPRVSRHLSLVGRYIVLMPETDIITVSQKIEDEKEQKRLKEEIAKVLPKNFGVIIRTSAIDKNINEIQKDMNALIKRWENIKNIQSKEKAPFCVERNNGITRKIITDTIDNGVTKITTNNKNIFEEVQEILKEFENAKIKLELEEKEDILEIYNIRNQIEKLENRKIWLKCGGFITIDKTEALIAIDVNSGKYTGKESLEQTVLKVNKEASAEIAKQLRLRDIGGIIIIDYIDMEKEESKKQVIKELEDNLKKDRSKTQILEFTKLNLLEMTRKHMFSNE